MKFLSLLFITILLLISVGSIFSLIRLANKPIIIPSSQSIAGFDPAQNQIPGVPEINQRMKDLIILHKEEESHFRNWTIWLNLGVTILTALAALIATITTVRAVTKKSSVITIAILTFCSSILNYGQNYFTSEKELAAQKTEQIKKWRTELESLTPNDLRNQLERYNNELDGL